MQWNTDRPFVPLDRLRLRRHALRYAGHGWAVTPGACLTGSRFSCGRPGCPIMTCHPAMESWAETASTDTRTVQRWWRHRPYSVLLATGRLFDVLEVPASLGSRAGAEAGPVAVTAAGRWMFLVRPGAPLRDELDHRLDVVRHGHGSWIPAPPSRMFEGPVRWAVPPERAQWTLPDPEIVQDLLVAALGPATERTAAGPRITVPRQMSTSRRAA
jgi:hypothetical protein